MEQLDAEDGYIEYSYINEAAQRETVRVDAQDMASGTSGILEGDKKLTLTVAPAQFAEKYQINVYDKDGTLKTDEAIETSIVDYLNAIKDDETYGGIAKALLDYGQASNEYFNYSAKHEVEYSIPTSDKYGTDLTEAESAHLLSNAVAKDYIIGKDASGKDISITGVSYVALVEPELRFYVSQTNEVWAALTNVSIEGEGLTAQMVKTDNGNCVIVTGIKASDFAKEFTLTIGGTSITYNCYAYLYSVFTNSNDDNLKNLAKAVYRFAAASEAIA